MSVKSEKTPTKNERSQFWVDPCIWHDWADIAATTCLLKNGQRDDQDNTGGNIGTLVITGRSSRRLRCAELTERVTFIRQQSYAHTCHTQKKLMFPNIDITLIQLSAPLLSPLSELALPTTETGF